jgi:hypothetical protein
MKLTVTKSKNSACFYVQKSIRKPNGAGTTTITIEKLGNIDEVKAKAKGQDPYKWAQEYVNELNRKEYEEQKSIIVSYSPAKLIKSGEQKSFNCGYLFLQNIYYSLGLDKICKKISSKHSFEYDLNDILSKLIYTRILYPASKFSSVNLASKFIEQPNFQLHDVYRALSVLAEESDLIQSMLYENSLKVLDRRKDILYYDCTNFYFELEQADDFRKYGKSKQHQPLPLVGMGLFMDYDGIPLAFDIYPGNQNEQPTLKTIENEQMYDGFYAVCTNLDDIRIDEIIKINKKRWEIEECFRIMKTEFKARPVYLQRENHIKAHFITCFIALFVYRILEKKVGEKYTCEQLIDTMRDMIMERPGNGQGYIPIYTRTKITDALHETAGFRTDYEILTDISMKKVIRLSKGKKK